MFKKIMTAGIMCLALANSAAAQGAAGAAGTGAGAGAAAAAGAGAGGVVIGGVAIGAVPLAIGAVVLVAAVGRWGQFRAYRHSQLRPRLSNFNTVESVEIWPQIGLFGFTKVYLVNRR
jgi:hypothetical protein